VFPSNDNNKGSKTFRTDDLLYMNDEELRSCHRTLSRLIDQTRRVKGGDTTQLEIEHCYVLREVQHRQNREAFVRKDREARAERYENKRKHREMQQPRNHRETFNVTRPSDVNVVGA
jgi:hypothetical protein